MVESDRPDQYQLRHQQIVEAAFAEIGFVSDNNGRFHRPRVSRPPSPKTTAPIFNPRWLDGGW
jgi:hypothetical protein